MKFKGYKYKFRLNVSHGLNIKEHHHTIEITLFIDNRNKYFETVDADVEKMVDTYLKKYSGKHLNETPPFNAIEPTIENIGKEFYKQIKEIAINNSYNLTKLEISETPTRVYIVSELLNKSATETTLREKKLAFLIEDVIKNKRRPDNTVKLVNNIVEKKELIVDEEAVGVDEESSEIIEEAVGVYGEESVINKKKHLIIKCFVSYIFIVLSAMILVYYIKEQGIYPSGYDIFGHLFKSNLLYENLKEGNLYPLYTKLWFNGVQPFRYWGPIPYYLMALLQFIVNGNVINSYLLFIGVSFTIGALGWIKFGIKYNRVFLSPFIGCLWFFLPDNVRGSFLEGNIPRMVIVMLLPYLFYYIWEFIEYKKKCCIFKVTILMCLISLCNVMLATMVVIGTGIFILIYSFINKRFKESIYLLLGMLLSFLIVGIWLYSALQGGVIGIDNVSTSEAMYGSAFKATVSLNPFAVIDGNGELFYFGLSVIIVAVLGVFLSNKKSIAGFLTVLIIFLGTTTDISPLISNLPLNKFFLMIRFIPLAYGFFIIGVLEWKKCRKIFVCLICLLIFLDTIPTMNLKNYEDSMGVEVKAPSIEELGKDYFLKVGKAVTNQRLASFDISGFGSFPILLSNYRI